MATNLEAGAVGAWSVHDLYLYYAYLQATSICQNWMLTFCKEISDSLKQKVYFTVKMHFLSIAMYT